jgi:hypothetical protein
LNRRIGVNPQERKAPVVAPDLWLIPVVSRPAAVGRLWRTCGEPVSERWIPYLGVGL